MRSLQFGQLVDEGDGCQAFVIAEAGVNHNGDANLAHALIDAAAEAGADAVKFQTFSAGKVATSGSRTARYQEAAGAGVDQRVMLEQLELRPNLWLELSEHAIDRGLVFLSTAFDSGSLELLIGLGVTALKIPSGELTNLTYLESHASCGLPCLISTGMATMAEVETAVDIFRRSSADYALLQCVTAYPTPISASNLRTIRTMRNQFNVPVGWSDHTIGNVTAIAARALGATVFEKHLTLDKNMVGPDHAASASPTEFAEYVNSIRLCEAALGSGVKEPAEVELENRVVARRSFYACRSIEAGEQLSADNVEALRPAQGIPASERIAGRVAAKAIPSGSPIKWADLV